MYSELDLVNQMEIDDEVTFKLISCWLSWKRGG